MAVYFGKNYRLFTSICDCHFGREVITTTAEAINDNNILAELARALYVHERNRMEIDYLDNYYRGDQPILYRRKRVRPEVNNRVVINLAQFIVETKTSETCGEPIQYVLRGTDKMKEDEITQLNALMDGEDKPYFDIELCRWRSICGTAYRYIGNKLDTERLLDESPFYLDVCDPRTTFVCYYQGGRIPAFGCQITKNAKNIEVFWVYTSAKWYKVIRGKILDSGININGAIPIIEYPNNARRLSDIEVTITLTDEINKMASDRSNGIEQFVSAWVKFVNCEIDEEEFAKMRQEGALVVKSNNGSENKADVDVMTSELNQEQTQISVNDLYEKLLVVQGMANRQTTTGGDTGSAVQLRNGHYDAEKRAELAEPIFKRSERNALRIVLNKLRIDKGFSLLPSDIEIKISRSKLDNMLTKAEVLQILLGCGIDNARAIKSVGLFSDPEQVAAESRKRMEILYPTTVSAENGEVNGSQQNG